MEAKCGLSSENLEALAKELSDWNERTVKNLQAIQEEVSRVDEQAKLATEQEKALQEESEKLLRSCHSSDTNRASSSSNGGFFRGDIAERMWGKNEAKRHRGPLPRMK